MAPHQNRDSVETLYFRVAKLRKLKAFRCTLRFGGRNPNLSFASDRLMTKPKFSFAFECCSNPRARVVMTDENLIYNMQLPFQGVAFSGEMADGEIFLRERD